MASWQAAFTGKKITVMGLGLLGRGAGDARFLAEQGAELIVTDLKDEAALADSLAALKGFSNVSFRLGGHDFDDFRDRDVILKAAGVPQDSPYVAEARTHGIPIKMSASWFAELANVPLVGVTGTRGKSTVTHLLYDIMRAEGMRVLLGGNVRGVSTLSLLPEATRDSIALMELDSWQLQGFGEAGISPELAVFTSFMPDHLNYYLDLDAYLADKSHMFLHQKPDDTLVLGKQAEPLIRERYGKRIRSHVVIADPANFPEGAALSIPGAHNVANAVCALEAARSLGIDDDVSKKTFASFVGLPGRLEFVLETNGVKIWNDNSATTPDATVAALRAVGDPKAPRVVLIIGGDEKNLDMSGLIAEIPKWCKAVVLFKERGTARVRDAVFSLVGERLAVHEEEGLEASVKRAFALADAGDTVLFSPAFSSFGKYFKNEFDRGEQFVRIAKAL